MTTRLVQPTGDPLSAVPAPRVIVDHVEIYNWTTAGVEVDPNVPDPVMHASRRGPTSSSTTFASRATSSTTTKTIPATGTASW